LKKFPIDALLEEVRSTYEEENRQNKLKKLAEKIEEEVPAIFLYSPKEFYAFADKLKGEQTAHLISSKDRFSLVQNWFVKSKYQLPERSWWAEINAFMDWLKNEIFKSDHV